MSWRGTSGTRSTKRPSSKSKPSAATVWISCGQSAIASTGNNWTRYFSHPLTPPLLPPHKGSLLQQTLWCAYQWRGLCPRATGLDKLRVQDPGRLRQPVLSHRRPSSGRCLLDAPEDVPPPLRPRPRTHLHQYGPLMGCPSQEDRCWARVAHRLRPASVRREGDAWKYLKGFKAPCQSQQSSARWLRPRKA